MTASHIKRNFLKSATAITVLVGIVLSPANAFAQETETTVKPIGKTVKFLIGKRYKYEDDARLTGAVLNDEGCPTTVEYGGRGLRLTVIIDGDEERARFFKNSTSAGAFALKHCLDETLN